ncbi:MAG: hypothetical protein JWS10_946 [Cypionkella sp.]|uniref:phage protein Gp27 family protein n=1 Tax=Cypionkella sp. TaxID=2811411 RepID=UPI002610CE2A|nr:phage protein Gp27 family protein [Cypionkella sp.]MDB5658331.1 hypothetical protein [Cypionkella sp.]
MAIGRGRLSSFQTMPTEAEGIVSWAAKELTTLERTQTDIYAEFVSKCEALMAEHRGELEFTIPAFSSFNRYSIRLARLSKRLSETSEIVAVLADKFDAKASDDLTVLTGETIKALVFQMLGDADSMKASDAMMLASAFKQAAQAQHISSDRRRKLETEFAKKVETAVDTVAKAAGMTKETAEKIKSEILGVQA